MKVLFLAKSCPVFGGVERWLVDLLEHLRLLGLDARIALAQGARFNLPERFERAYCALGAYHVVDGSGGGSDDRRCALEAVIRYEQPDVVVPILLADGLDRAAALRQELGFAIVYPIHELCVGVARDLTIYQEYIDHVVVVDRQSEVFYSEPLMKLPSRLSCVPCGVRAGPESLPSVKPLGGAVRLGWVGRIQERQKRASDLVGICRELAAQSIPFDLKVAGVGSAESLLRAELSDEIERGCVSFVGSRTREQLYADFYPQLDALLVTSAWETGPLVAFEAMMNGAVVVTSDFLGRSQNGVLVDQENCLVFRIGDTQAAVECIRRLGEESGLAERLTRCGVAYAHAERRLEVMTQRWAQILSAAVSHRSTAGDTRGYDSSIRMLASPMSRATHLKCAVKRLIGRRFLHAHPGEEWPIYSE
jgi:glycosyltransferase involved in cell wall biosynthesis